MTAPEPRFADLLAAHERACVEASALHMRLVAAEMDYRLLLQQARRFRLTARPRMRLVEGEGR